MDSTSTRYWLGHLPFFAIGILGYGVLTGWTFPSVTYIGPDSASLLWVWWEGFLFFWMLGLLLRHLGFLLLRRPRTRLRSLEWAWVLVLLGGFLYGLWDIWAYARRTFIYNAEPIWPQVKQIGYVLAFLSLLWLTGWIRTLRRVFPRG
ncbi:MAG TPA: hypothetical protein DCE41_35925 [Cytophagales bacterium]|nr:hypothetical protein [Cytophagales bacterium]HAA21487.1 hypothetical protein [Cytophagales bacterium]HAP64620.1 hypothetical protein [Cytophagales bacterium]